MNNALGQTPCFTVIIYLRVCLSVVSLFQVVRYSARARLTAAALRQSGQNTHTHTQMRCSGKYVLWFLLAMVGAQSRGAQRRVFISIMHHFLSNTHPHTNTHTHTSSDCSYLGAVYRRVYLRVRVCVCVRVQSETPVVVLKCKCMLEMTNLQQICFTWHTASSRVCICSIACKCVTVLAAVVSIV